MLISRVRISSQVQVAREDHLIMTANVFTDLQLTRCEKIRVQRELLYLQE